MSHTNIITVNSTEINNSGPFRVGSTLTSGTAGQVLKSQGRDKSPIWDTDIDTTYQGSATIDIDTTTDPDTINVIKVPNTLTITDSAGSSVVFDGSSTQSITINDNDNQLNLTGALPIIINNGGGLNREVELQYDTTTLGAGGGALEVLRVPNNLTAGTNISFSSGTTYNGSSAITINATDTDNQLNLTEDNGIQITNTGGLNRTIGAKVDGTTVDFDGDQLSVKKVPNDLTAGTNISFSSGTTYDGSSAITINATDTDTTYQGGTGISIDTTTNPDTINCQNIPNSALANSTISGKSLGTSLANLTFYSSSGAFITSYNGADPPTSVVLDGDTTYTGGKNITVDTTTNPDEIDLDDDLTGIDSITMTTGTGATAITGNSYYLFGYQTTCTNLDLRSSTNLIPGGVLATKIQRTATIRTFSNSYSEFSSNFRTSFVAQSTNVMVEFRALVRADNRVFYGGLYDYNASSWNTDQRNRFNFNDETDQDFTVLTWWMRNLTPGTTYYISPYFRGSSSTVYIYAGHSGTADGFAPGIMRVIDGGNNVNIY